MINLFNIWLELLLNRGCVFIKSVKWKIVFYFKSLGVFCNWYKNYLVVRVNGGICGGCG